MEKMQQFNAGVILTRDEVKELLDSGVKVSPMQWVETDKNAHKRRDGVKVEPELKSRLVGCGNFEEDMYNELRTDSPAGDVDAHNLVLSWCASNKVRLRSADISSAYLQGREVDRIILYRIPKGGIPEEGVEDGAIIAARVPIYGTRDAGRGFWLRLKEVVKSEGYDLNQILPTVFMLRKDGRIVSVMSSNVDDLLYGSLPDEEHHMQKILDTFNVREQNEGKFRFCGKEITQNGDFSIDVNARDNTEKIRPIDIKAGRKLTDRCTPDESTALRSVTASLAWIARQVRPDLSYRVSKLQTAAGKGFVKDLKECNKVLDYALSTSDQGLHFTADGIDWDNIVVCTITDASFCNETIYEDGQKLDGRSQQGFVLCIAPAGIANMTEAPIHPIAWSSTVTVSYTHLTLPTILLV